MALQAMQRCEWVLDGFPPPHPRLPCKEIRGVIFLPLLETLISI